MICRVLDEERPRTAPPFRHSGCSALVALSRTCRIFSEVATSLLWQQQFGFFPVLCCLPADLLTITRPAERRIHIIPRLVFHREIQPEDWTRALWYSQHVKRLILCTPEAALGFRGALLGDNIDVLQSLSSSLFRCGGKLFPNLEHLHYRTGLISAAAYPFLELVSGSRLTSIIYSADGLSNLTDLRLVRSIAQRSPTITDFTFNFEDDSAAPSEECLQIVIDVLRQFPNLQHTSLPCWIPLLPQLASATALQALSLRGRKGCNLLESFCRKTGVPAVAHSFLNIQTLSLEFETGLQLLLFLQNVTFFNSCIEVLHLFLNQNPPVKVQYLILHQIYQKIPMSSALHISFIIRHSMDNDCFSITHLTDCLLLSKGLLSLEIFMPEFSDTRKYLLRITDPLVEKLAHGWSHLQELTIAPYVEGDTSIQGPQTTLRCLASLAEFCPQLSYLQIMLDASLQIPDPAEILPVGEHKTKHRSVIDLRFANPSPISEGNVPGVARFLLDVFYEIAGLEVDSFSEYCERWCGVRDLILDTDLIPSFSPMVCDV
jgi:hypothetical protein